MNDELKPKGTVDRKYQAFKKAFLLSIAGGDKEVPDEGSLMKTSRIHQMMKRLFSFPK